MLLLLLLLQLLRCCCSGVAVVVAADFGGGGSWLWLWSLCWLCCGCRGVPVSLNTLHALCLSLTLLPASSSAPLLSVLLETRRGNRFSTGSALFLFGGDVGYVWRGRCRRVCDVVVVVAVGCGCGGCAGYAGCAGVVYILLSWWLLLSYHK